jgi:hypothetical protein
MTDTPMPVIDGHNDVLLSLYKPKPGEERSSRAASMASRPAARA